jgi:hypothetical protein
MTKKTTGWTVGLAGFGMMCGLMGSDLIQLMKLGEVVSPSFMGNMLLHISAVIAAFVGGRLIPDARDVTERTRSTDKPIIPGDKP